MKCPQSHCRLAGGPWLQLDEARKAWAAQVASLGVDRADKAPAMPGVAVLSAIRANLFDDVGTIYARTTGRVAGDGGSEWRVTWFFALLPPAEASELRLHFYVGADPLGVDNGKSTGAECRVRLTFAASSGRAFGCTPGPTFGASGSSYIVTMTSRA